MPKKPRQIMMDDDLWKKIQVRAAERGVSAGHLVRVLIEKGVDDGPIVQWLEEVRRSLTGALKVIDERLEQE